MMTQSRLTKQTDGRVERGRGAEKLCWTTRQQPLESWRVGGASCSALTRVLETVFELSIRYLTLLLWGLCMSRRARFTVRGKKKKKKKHAHSWCVSVCDEFGIRAEETPHQTWWNMVLLRHFIVFVCLFTVILKASVWPCWTLICAGPSQEKNTAQLFKTFYLSL